jgi:hypothetical protein
MLSSVAMAICNRACPNSRRRIAWSAYRSIRSPATSAQNECGKPRHRRSRRLRRCGSRVADWWLTKDGDRDCLALYEKHYSAYRYADGRVRDRFAGPGQKIVLRTKVADAFFVWRKFIDQCIDHRTGERQAGINCAAFRNESTARSSDLIRQADAIADAVWPDCRHYTYVNAKAVASRNPGYCFLAAGWKRCGMTKSGLLILERVTCAPILK